VIVASATPAIAIAIAIAKEATQVRKIPTVMTRHPAHCRVASLVPSSMVQAASEVIE
jgi:hypothetical protein